MIRIGLFYIQNMENKKQRMFVSWETDLSILNDLNDEDEVIIRINGKNKHAVFMMTADDPSKSKMVFKTYHSYISQKEIEAFIIIPKYEV